MTPRALLFDFDGVVCDTERAARRSWHELYATHGRELPAAVWAAMAGRSTGYEVATRDLEQRLGRPLTPAEVARRLQRKGELAQEEPLRPGLDALTAEALARGTRLAVVSNSPAAWVNAHLDRLGVRERFAVVVSGDGPAPHKPAPDLYLEALTRLDIEATGAVAFEDSPAGIRAAQAAGLRCVAVPSTAGRAGLDAASLVLESLLDYRLEQETR